MRCLPVLVVALLSVAALAGTAGSATSAPHQALSGDISTITGGAAAPARAPT